MQNTIYDIHCKNDLIIGYSEENNARSVEFRGFTKDKANSTVYLMIDDIGLIPLLDFCFDVEYSYTLSAGKYKAILVEKTADDTFIKKSATFGLVVKHSVPIGDIAAEETASFTNWFDSMSALYQTVQTKLANGEFKGAKGDKGDTGNAGQNGSDGADGFSPTVTTSKTGKTTTITITDKNGTRTATVLDGNDGQNGRDGTDGRDGSDASVTSSNIASALGYTPADEDDVEQLNGDLATYNNTKVGYSEVENGQLKMYSDNTKAHLLATLDLPSGDVTASGNNVFTGVNKFQNGSASGCMVFGAEVNSSKNRAGFRKLARLSYPTTVEGTNCAFMSCDTQGTFPQLGVSGDYNSVEFGGRDGDVSNTSPDIITFTVAKEHNVKSYGKKVSMMTMDKDNIAMEVIPTVNGKTLVKAELTDDTLPAWTSEQQTKALARLNAEKAKGEWVLKGTLNTDNKDSGVAVDLSGCTELIITGTGVATGNVSIMAYNFSGLIYNAFTSAIKLIYASWEDTQFGFENRISRKSNSASSTSVADAGGYGYSYVGNDGKHIANITKIVFSDSSPITSCDIKIYAR